VELHIDGFQWKGGAKVLLIDDLIATGGTAKAGVDLIKKVGAECLECCFIVELEFLKGRGGIETPVYSVLKF